MTIKKKLSKKRPDGAGAVVLASPTSKSDQLLAALKRNMERATEPELKQRLCDAIRAMEQRGRP
jgi:hypothetical protein